MGTPRLRDRMERQAHAVPRERPDRREYLQAPPQGLERQDLTVRQDHTAPLEHMASLEHKASPPRTERRDRTEHPGLMPQGDPGYPGRREHPGRVVGPGDSEHRAGR